jgi:UDP-glucose 4-epimerase
MTAMKLRHNTILVTGGAGFIGSHLVKTLIPHHEVTVYDNYFSSITSPKEFKKLGTHSVVVGDILDQKTLDKAMLGIDVVFHLAATCVRISLTRPRFVHDTNATGTLNVLLAAKKAKVKRVIYISSSEAYGTAQGKLIDELHPMAPTTVYGMSKYMGELYTRHFNDMYDLPGLVVRPFNTYGTQCHFKGPAGEIIARSIIRALNGKQPLLFGTGAQTRDFTYVSDTVRGIIQAAECDKLLGDSINIAYGKEVSISQIARIICQQTGLPYQPIMKPARPNDVARHAASIKKAQKMLHYQPKINISHGIATLIDWYKRTYPNPKSLMQFIPDVNW